LDAFFEHGYVQRLIPDAPTRRTGLENAVAHFGRVQDLYKQDGEFLRAIFVMTFEAIKDHLALRQRVPALAATRRRQGRSRAQARRTGRVVRADVDVERADDSDVSAAIFGIRLSVDRDAEWLRPRPRSGISAERFIRDYGSE